MKKLLSKSDKPIMFFSLINMIIMIGITIVESIVLRTDGYFGSLEYRSSVINGVYLTYIKLNIYSMEKMKRSMIHTSFR